MGSEMCIRDSYKFRSSALWFIFNFLDVFAGLSSIFHLTVISLERLHATLRPFRHRQLSLKAYWVAIATPWFLSLSVGISILMLTWFSLIMQQKLLIIVIICLLTPLLITCFFLSVNLATEEKKYRKRLLSKPRTKILEDHFPCNSSIVHNMVAFSVFKRRHKRVSHSSIGRFLYQAPSVQ